MAQDLKPYLVYPAAQQHLQLVSAAIAKPEDANKASTNKNGKDNNSQAETLANDALQTKDGRSTTQNFEAQPQAPFFEDDEPEYIVPIDDGETPNNQPELNSTSEKAKIWDTNAATNDPPPKPLPLQEISPNSPTKPKSSTNQLDYEKELLQQAQDREILSDTLQTILSRQKSSGGVNSLQRSASSGSARGTSNRRDRRLLGRATSNLSARSGIANGPFNVRTNFSRASSIDTLNTNGVGTPIEGLPPAPLSASLTENGKDGQSSLTAATLSMHEELLAADDDEQDPADETLQMTQVRYEDPEAGRWRAKLLKRITASKSGQLSPAIDLDDNEEQTAADDAPRGMLLEDDPGASRIATAAGRRTRQQRVV